MSRMLPPRLRLRQRTRKARNEIFNAGEESTPTMAERLALLPERPGEPPDLPPFDYNQPLVTDTTKIRSRLGYADVIDEGPAIMQLAALATSSPKNGRA